MFSWRQLLGYRAGAGAAAAKDTVNSNVRLLAITANDRFYSTLVDIGSSCGWEVRRAGSIQEGMGLIRSHSAPLVVLDWDEDANDWRDGLRRVCAAHEQVCVLLASRVVDDNLREEVLRFHGYDVLPKNADREQIVRAVQFAWFWITRSTALTDRAMKKESQH